MEIEKEKKKKNTRNKNDIFDSEEKTREEKRRE